MGNELDFSEKKLRYQAMLYGASKPLQLIAVGSVSCIFLSGIWGLVVDPWQGFAGLSVAWYLKGWSFRKMAEEAGQICPECGGEVV